jgi:predicted N-acetyltransferase YhbS
VIELVPLTDVDDEAVEALLDRAFKPSRRQRTAYAVRGDVRALAALSFAALDGGQLAGSVQCWPITFTADAGPRVPLVMVGPVAVAPERQRDGVGRELMARSLFAAAAHGCDDGLVLIGDPEYYQRFFGFSAERTGQWRLPGPVERRRLLARGLRVPDEPGVLGPA